jgi:hypothetical protein
LGFRYWTGYQESFDINEQLQQIITQLRNKVSIFSEIKKIYSVECKFFIVVEIEEGNTPGLYLEGRTNLLHERVHYLKP